MFRMLVMLRALWMGSAPCRNFFCLVLGMLVMLQVLVMLRVLWMGSAQCFDVLCRVRRTFVMLKVLVMLRVLWVGSTPCSNLFGCSQCSSVVFVAESSRLEGEVE